MTVLDAIEIRTRFTPPIVIEPGGDSEPSGLDLLGLLRPMVTTRVAGVPVTIAPRGAPPAGLEWVAGVGAVAAVAVLVGLGYVAGRAGRGR